jgi:hypothetical protein
LHQQNVRVELFGFDSSPHAFDYQRFFVEAFPETKAGEETPFRQVSDMDEFSREIKKRRQIKRVLAKLDFTLCADMRLAVNVYNLYSETKRPYFSHVCARNNAVAMSRTRFEPKGPPISIGAAAAAAEEAPPAVTETKLVDRSELVQIFNYGGKNIVFSAHEMIQIRGLLEPGKFAK